MEFDGVREIAALSRESRESSHFRIGDEQCTTKYQYPSKMSLELWPSWAHGITHGDSSIFRIGWFFLSRQCVAAMSSNLGISKMPLSAKHQMMLTKLSGVAPKDAVLRLIEKVATDGDPTPGTQLVRYSNIKKAFKDMGHRHWVDLVKPPRSLITKVHANAKHRLENKSNFVITQTVLARLRKLRLGDTREEHLLYLQFQSGRRTHELLTSKFWLEDGMVKTTELNKKRAPEICTIKIMDMTGRAWLQALEAVQGQIEGENPASVHRAMNRRLKELFPDMEDMSTHKLRGIYANVMWKRHGHSQIKTGYIKKVLCLDHQEVALHYSNYVIKAKKTK